MAKGPTKVPEPKARFPWVRGTWPPQPEPIAAASRIKPEKPSTRDYGKIAKDAMKEDPYGP